MANSKFNLPRIAMALRLSSRLLNLNRCSVRSIHHRHHNTMASFRIPPAADFHVHLRDGKMMETVVPTIRQGGASLAYVMVR